MSRKVMRVPLDFDWPLEKVWEGYRNPHSRVCPLDREGLCFAGTSLRGKWLEDIVHLLMVAGADAIHAARRGPRPNSHPYFDWLKRAGLVPSKPAPPDFAELTQGLAGRPAGLLGHDAIDRWSATAAVLKAAGLPATPARPSASSSVPTLLTAY